MSTLPALRTDIELFPVRVDGRDALLVRDPLGIVAPNAALAVEIAPFLPLFNGSSTIGDLQALMTRLLGGVLVFESQVHRIVRELSDLGILDTEEYREARERIVREFTSGGTRPAAFAGRSYPEDPGALSAMLDRLLALPAPPAGPPTVPCALAAPHIDIHAAERTYAAAYGAIRGAAPSAVLLLGTGHALSGARYCLCTKTFTTPLGEVRTDRDAAERIRAAGARALTADDFPHRNEHSLEFQLLFLQRLFPMAEVPILPVLCGGLDDLFGTGRSPREEAGIAPFVDALADWLARPPAGKLVVAGVDLSHVGPKFGDPCPASSLEPAVRAADRELLDALASGDADAFFAAGAAAGGRYRVCGFAALWTLLAVLPGTRGTVLDYDLRHEEPTRSAVSFAAVAFASSPP